MRIQYRPTYSSLIADSPIWFEAMRLREASDSEVSVEESRVKEACSTYSKKSLRFILRNNNAGLSAISLCDTASFGDVERLRDSRLMVNYLFEVFLYGMVSGTQKMRFVCKWKTVPYKFLPR